MHAYKNKVTSLTATNAEMNKDFKVLGGLKQRKSWHIAIEGAEINRAVTMQV